MKKSSFAPITRVECIGCSGIYTENELNEWLKKQGKVNVVGIHIMCELHSSHPQVLLHLSDTNPALMQKTRVKVLNHPEKVRPCVADLVEQQATVKMIAHTDQYRQQPFIGGIHIIVYTI